MVIDGEDLHTVPRQKLRDVYNAVSGKTDDTESSRNEDAARLLKTMLTSQIISCPRCTNTTLKISRMGFYD